MLRMCSFMTSFMFTAFENHHLVLHHKYWIFEDTKYYMSHMFTYRMISYTIGSHRHIYRTHYLSKHELALGIMAFWNINLGKHIWFLPANLTPTDHQQLTLQPWRPRRDQAFWNITSSSWKPFVCGRWIRNLIVWSS